ncbi:cysteine proteinase inhibitor [Trifolium repens]|nr:cysteine proteinase inhibitor [Trifolium repens]
MKIHCLLVKYLVGLLVTIILVIILMVFATKHNQNHAGWRRIGPIIGGWNPIEDINNSHVTDIANFAVNKFNNQTGASLKFQKVIRGESQIVAGINYCLIISTSNSVNNIYNVVVYDRPWDHFRNLTSFIPIIHH